MEGVFKAVNDKLKQKKFKCDIIMIFGAFSSVVYYIVFTVLTVNFRLFLPVVKSSKLKL